MTDGPIPIDEARRRRKAEQEPNVTPGRDDNVDETITETAETHDETIDRLSQLSGLEYEAVRKEEARRLSFRVGPANHTRPAILSETQPWCSPTVVVARCCS